MLLVGKHKTGSVFPSAYQYLIRTSSEKWVGYQNIVSFKQNK
jgi:hypothetical protein